MVILSLVLIVVHLLALFGDTCLDRPANPSALSGDCPTVGPADLLRAVLYLDDARKVAEAVHDRRLLAGQALDSQWHQAGTYALEHCDRHVVSPEPWEFWSQPLKRTSPL